MSEGTYEHTGKREKEKERANEETKGHVQGLEYEDGDVHMNDVMEANAVTYCGATRRDAT